MNARIDAERILDAFLAPEADRLPDRVIDAALDDIARTPQRRALRVPWRFPLMPALTRATSLAAVALVAAVGVGGVIYLNSASPGGPGGPGTPASPAPSPTAAQTAPPVTPIHSASPISLVPYTSGVHGYTMAFPEGWSSTPASRAWQAGDSLANDAWPYADVFVSPGDGNAQIALLAWEMPAGDGADLDSVQGLKAWAEGFCPDVVGASCQGFTELAEPMCLDAGGDPCRPAILVPTAVAQYAFFMDWASAVLTSAPDKVRVVIVAREDDFAPAAAYGGSVALLKAILATTDVR